MNYRLNIVLVIVFCSVLLQVQAQHLTSSVQQLDSRIEAIFSASELPGFSIVVVDSAGMPYQKSMGYADLAIKKPFTDSTILNIASISKTFIGIAIMKAIEQGKVNLDEDINTYLPFVITHPHFPKLPITLRHLATHTSGINDDKVYFRSYVLQKPEEDYSSLPKKVHKYISLMRGNSKIDDSEFLKNSLNLNGKWFSKKNFTKKAPGTEYLYSNIGAALAAYVIENAVGAPYEDYTRKFIFKPLQMTQTGWEISEVHQSNFANRYFRKDIPVPDYYLVTKADGALITNTTDFGKYLLEMLRGINGKGMLLSSKSYEKMFERKQFGKESSGIFWGVSASGKPNHSGSDPGVLTNTVIDPKRNLGLFFMTNVGIELDKQVIKTLKQLWNAIKEHNW